MLTVLPAQVPSLIKNLKALIGLAAWFADDALLACALRRLRRQLAVQVDEPGNFVKAVHDASSDGGDSEPVTGVAAREL